MENKNEISKPVAVVILNWNGATMLEQFLPSVLQYSPMADIVVADNASTDNSLALLSERFPTVQCVVLDKNYGFAEGYNRALKQLNYPYYVLLNSDVEVTSDWLNVLYNYMETHTDVAACQPKLRCHWAPNEFEYAGAAGGFVDVLGYPYCRGRLMGAVESDYGQYDAPLSVLWASGAALMVRSKDYWEVGALDGRFFAHQEEIDLCWRLRSRGKGVVCVPQSVVFHLGGGTLPKDNPHKTYLNFRNNLLLLYKNLPEDRLHKVMRWRFWLDALASFKFLATLQWGCFIAVWRGRRDFYQMRDKFVPDRKVNQALAVQSPVPEQTSFSLLWQYYVKGVRKWSDLPEL